MNHMQAVISAGEVASFFLLNLSFRLPTNASILQWWIFYNSADVLGPCRRRRVRLFRKNGFDDR
jgi:hypothetical protein